MAKTKVMGAAGIQGIKQYIDSKIAGLVLDNPEEIKQIIIDYFTTNNQEIVTNEELDTVLAEYLKTADLDLSGKQDVIADLETIRSNAAAGPTAVQGVAERVSADEALDARIKVFEQIREPEVKEISGKTHIYANGTALRIVDNSTANIAYYADSDGVQKTLDIPYGAIVHGGGLGTATNRADFPSSMIIMESGNLRGIYGGSRAYGNVGVATIIVNNGKLIEGPTGGGAAPNANELATVGEANVIMNGGESLTVYGGGMGRATVGSVYMEINGGTHKWVTAGGANGTVGSAEAIINGGNIICLQSVNRGVIEEAKVRINGGTITNVYAGGEPDATVTGKCEKAILELEGGTFTLNKGTYGGTEDASRCSGYYRKNVITAEVAATCNLVEKDIDATQTWVEDKNYLTAHQDISGKLNILPNVEDESDPGYGYPYWIPYSFATTPKADGLDIILKTLTLDNTFRKMNFTNAFPVATTTLAGLITSADKTKLDGLTQYTVTIDM